MKYSNPLFTLTTQELRLQTRRLNYPCRLEIAPSEWLVLLKPLRVVPGKRLTVLVERQNTLFIAKLFFESKKAAHQCDKDYEGIQHFLSADIPTANICYSGSTCLPGVYLILFEYLEHAITLKKAWIEAKSLEQQDKLLSIVASIIVQHHRNSLVQKDSHPDNFLLLESKCYSLDGSSVCRLNLSMRKCLKNLAGVASYIALIHNGRIDPKKWIIAYEAHSGKSIADKDYSYFYQQYRQLAEDEIERYLKKALRDSTKVICQKKVKQNIWFLREHYPEALIPQLIAAIEGLSAQQKKQEIEVEGSFFSVIASSSKQVWLNYHLLMRLAIPTIKALGLIQGQNLYYLLSRIQATEQSLENYLLAHHDEPGCLSSILSQVLVIIEKLTEFNCFYKNLSPDFFVVNNHQVELTELFELRYYRVCRNKLKMFHMFTKKKYKQGLKLPEFYEEHRQLGNKIEVINPNKMRQDLLEWTSYWPNKPKIHAAIKAVLE